MTTLTLFSRTLQSIPTSVSWYLADLGESRGKQELFTRRSPQRLKTLREHALIESAVSSNRIEGVEIDRSRVATVVFGKPPLRDRDEEEVRGYRQALTWIHDRGAKIPISEETILQLHRMSRGDIWDAGKYKDKDGDIIERFPDGRSRTRFKTVRAKDTPAFMKNLVDLYAAAVRERRVPPLVLMAAFNLDFLCIHPFRDGNGRVSRLLLLLQCCHQGFEVGRYISLERLIEQNKDRYYETLQESSQGWHGDKHNPWPYIGCLLSILKMACKEFEERLGQVKSPRGAKTDLVQTALRNLSAEFTLADLERACPGVSRDMVRRVLRDLQSLGEVECVGRGPGAKWRRTKRGNTPKRG
ncbi:Fic family protein [Candidatus Sumerlaeota bacterium]|nr:Fic family protein [Candidatus Sumerlaeota bacterium]